MWVYISGSCRTLPADPGVGKLIETVLRNDLIIMRRGWVRTAGQHRQPAAVPLRRRGLRTPQSRDRSHWPFEEWGRFLPAHSTAVSLLDRLVDHNNVVATDGESYRMREARSRTAGRPSNR